MGRFWVLIVVLRVGNWLSVFSANHSFFARKRTKDWVAQKNKQFPNSLIFGEQLAHCCLFFVSDLLTVAHFCERSDHSSHRFKKEWVSKVLVFLNLQKIPVYVNIFEWITRFLWAKEQFTQKNQSDSLRLLFCHEWPERFTHGRSFLVSNLRANRSWLIIFGERPEQFAHSSYL